jgi:type II secretory pathway predicted ATPase ExeA
MLVEKLPKNVKIIYLSNPRLTPDTILQAIALEIHLDICNDSNKMSNHLQVMQAIQQYLLNEHAKNNQVLVLIEEAQGMPLETLEEIRLLSNLETTQNKLLQIALFGQPELDKNLSEKNIRQLKERITHSFMLEPFNRQEITEYIHKRMFTVGYRGQAVFTKKSVKKLAEISEGLSRRINILADKALLAAYADNLYIVKPRHIILANQDSNFISYKQKTKVRIVFIISLIFAVLSLLYYYDFR